VTRIWGILIEFCVVYKKLARSDPPTVSLELAFPVPQIVDSVP
jgi:hypothetical protein